MRVKETLGGEGELDVYVKTKKIRVEGAMKGLVGRRSVRSERSERRGGIVRGVLLAVMLGIVAGEDRKEGEGGTVDRLRF